MYDPQVTELASRAVEMAHYFNLWWVRTLLVLGVLVAMVWGTRPVWKARHKLEFLWKKKLTGKVWIPRDQAFELVRNSDWAQSRRKEKSTPFIDLWAFQKSVRDLETIKFGRFVSLVLNKFAENHPEKAQKDKDGKQEFDEGGLRDYLQTNFDKDGKVNIR